MPNSGIKGFPLLSGLVVLVEQMAISFHPKKVWAKKNYKKNAHLRFLVKLLIQKKLILEKIKNLTSFHQYFRY